MLCSFLGIFVGLLLAELAFWWRADGAFPHLNLYASDSELGVRLQPGGEQRLQFRNNPLTTIRINAQGFRGADFPSNSNNEILTVGDSQVFGLGVEGDETFSASLAKLSGRTVINGGVPAYGPQEYTAVVRRSLAERDIRAAVYVMNFANDLFELDLPNQDRHVVWGGWHRR